MRARSCLDTIGAILVLGAFVIIGYAVILTICDTSGLCSPDASSMRPPLAELTSAGYLLLSAGLGSYGRDYIKNLRGLGRRDLKRLFLTMVVAGGTVFSGDGKYCVRFYGKDLVLHRIFAGLAYSIYNAYPATVSITSRGSYVTQLYNKAAVIELREHSQGFSQRGVERNECPPTIGYVLEGGRGVRVEAGRLLMSTAGWITFSFTACQSGVRAHPRLGLGSVMPEPLVDECRELMSGISLQMDTNSDSRYPGTGFLVTCDPEALTQFEGLGGFIEGTSVKKGAFAGMEKNGLLRSAISLQGRIYSCKEEAQQFLKCFGDEISLDTKLYMNRIMLG